MWELDGQKFSLEQIEAILNKEKYKGNLDDFIAERGYTKVGPKVIGSSIQEVGEDVKKREDIVGEEKKQIELAQAEVDAAGPIELEEIVLTPKPKVQLEIEEPKYFGQEGYKPPMLTWLEENNTVEITPEDNKLLNLSPDLLKENEIEIVDLKQGREEYFRRRSELGNPNNFLTQASVDLYNNLTQRIVKINELLQPFENGKEMSIKQHFKNAFFNAGRDLGRVGEFWGGSTNSQDIATSRMWEAMIKSAMEQDGGRNLPYLEKALNPDLDPDSWWTEGIGDKEVYENINDFIKDLDQRRSTIPFIESIKEGKWGRGLASLAGAVINAVGSVAYFTGTGGSGYFFDFYAESWMEINEAKAARLGISVEELVQQGLDEVDVPLKVAGAKNFMEFIGMMPLSKVLGKMFKGKGVTAMDVMWASGSEYLTEIGQCGADAYNTEFAKSGNKKAAMEAAQAALGTQECQEQGIQGAFGSFGIAGTASVASNIRLKAANNIRTVDQTQEISKLSNEISTLQNKAANTADPVVKKGIESEIFNLENNIRRIVEDGNQVVNSLTDDQVNQVNDLGDQEIEILDDVSLLVKRLAEGIVTKEEYNIAIKGYINKYSYLENEINNIIKDVKINPNTPTNLQSFNYEEGGVETDLSGDPVTPYDKASDNYKSSDLGGGRQSDSNEKNKLVDEWDKLSEEEQEQEKENWKNEKSDVEYDEDGNIIVYRVGSIRDGVMTPMTTSKKMAETIANERKKQGLSSNITQTKIKEGDVKVWVRGSEAEVIVDVNSNNINDINDNSVVIKENESTADIEAELEADKKALENINYALETGKDRETGDTLSSNDIEIIKKAKENVTKRIKNREQQLKNQKEKTDSETITDNINQKTSDLRAEGEIELDEVVVTAPAKKGNINELARIGYDNLTPKQLTDFKNQYTSVALAAIGYDPTKGTIKPEDAQSFVDEQFVVIAKNYRPRDPKTNKKIDFTTYVYNTIGRRGPSLYGKQEGLEEAGQTTSLDDERAAQVADPSTVETTETVTTVQPTISIMGKGPQAEVLESKHVALIEASPLGKEILDTGKADIAKLNKLAEDVGAVLLAEELNIPVEVINNPKLNILKKHNPSNIQRYILKNAQLILNTLKANTNVEVVGSLKNPNVKIKVGGKPLKLPRKLLDLFFDKTDIRVGNNFQYKLKPNLTVKDIQTAVGILDGKVNPNFEFAKSGEMQAAKAFLLTLSRLRTNAALEGITTGEVAGTILSATPSKVKTATERAIDYLTAKEAKFKNITLIGIPPNALFSTLKGALKLYNGTNIKAVINYIKNKLRQFSASAANAISRIFANTVSKAADGIVFIDQVLAWGYGEKRTTLNDVLEGNGLEGVYNLNDRSKNGGRDQYKNFLKTTLFPMMPKSFWMHKKQITGSSQEILTTKEVTDILNSMKDSDFGAPIDNVTKYTRAEYKAIFGLTGKSTLQALNSEKGKEFNNNNMLIWESMLTRMNDIIIKNPEAARGFALAFKGVGSATNHWFKLGAEVLGADPKSKSLHWEHAMPATAAYKYLLNSMLNKNINFETTLELIKNNYKVIAIDTKDNTKIDKAPGKLKENMPSWWTIFDNWYDRYFNSQVGSINGGINPNSIQLADGKTLAEAFNINSNLGTQETINIEAEIKEAETINQGEKDIKNNPNLVPTAPKDLNKDFNIILEEVKGIAAKKRFSQIVARRVGRNKGRISKFFMGPGAQDFELLYYNFLGRGRKGEQQKRFFEDNLVKPYARGIAKMEVYSQQLKDDYAALKKLMPDTASILYNKIKGLNYTNDQALRIYLWDKAGYDIPGLSKRDRTAIVKHVQSNPNLLEFANGLTALSKQDNWVKPDAYWDTSDLLKDIYDLGHKVGRKQFLGEFINNSNEIFSESNLNKIEATYGIYLREAIENSLYRMKTGTNRKQGMDRATAAATQWISNSVGAIMFMNVRSASFQLLSMFNYINFQENNIFAIGQRILDVKQLSKDMYTILTSPKIKQRFAGEGRGIEESEIANALRNAKNKPQALLQYLLKVGFTFTRAADAMAIALGGAPYYRNNVIAFEKQGFSKEEAEAKAWEKFSETTEKFQQSADPRLLSQDQATTMGRWILAFQNTPGQYTRSIVKDMKDFVNRRRIPGLTQAQSDATYISRISYYGVIQNFVFVALANALFTLLPGWEDEEEEEMDKKAQRERNKQIRTINNMISTLLRGSGIYGAFVDTLKNVVMSYYKEQGKDPFAKDNANILVEIMNLMPTVGSKIRKINNSLKGEDYNKALIEERGWDVTIDGNVNLSPKYQVFSNLVEGVTNIPLARMTDEVTRIVEMLDERNSTLERVALTLGYRPWDLNIPNEEHDKLRLEISDRKRKQKQEKKRLEKEEKKRLENEKRFAGKSDEEIELMKTQDEIRDLTKSEQVTELETLGLTKKDIRALRLEDDRINKIIELREKKKAK